MKVKFSALAVSALAFAAGCNATTTQTAEPAPAAAPTPVAIVATSGSIAGQNKPLLEELQDANAGLSIMDPADLPTSGSASYSGFAQIIADGTVIPSSRAEIVGAADLDVSFAGRGGMTGTITDFDDETGTYVGTLNVSGGSISSGGARSWVRGDVEGTITRSTGEAYEVSGGLSGTFFGASGEYLNGIGGITVTSDGQSALTDISLNAARD